MKDSDAQDESPVVDVVIVNWNTSEKAIAAAEGYAGSLGVQARVVIVDNASVPSQKALLHESARGTFELIEPEINLGFGAAANLGLAHGSGQYVVVSNADVIPRPEALRALVAAARTVAGAGMVGPVFDNDSNTYHDRLPSRFTLIVRTGIGRYGRKSVDLPSWGQISVVQQPAGACFLMTRALWTEVGGLDEGYFLWYEDVDLAHRLHDAGKVGLVVGDARVEHVGGESFAKIGNRAKQSIRIDSLRRYISLHHRRMMFLASPLLWLSERLRGEGRRSAGSPPPSIRPAR